MTLSGVVSFRPLNIVASLTTKQAIVRRSSDRAIALTDSVNLTQALAYSVRRVRRRDEGLAP
jgi:hypothetical protein